ncbi:hypothetical protein MTO96_029687 [Rhipicephalus appendiculatus]
MSCCLNATSCATPWPPVSVAPQSGPSLLLALVNLLVHVPFNDLPVLHDYELGELRQQYDYVIVGGGSAGCVIANRLSADPRVTVLLLEAGGLETASRQIPAAAPFNLRGHDDWDYWTVPQKNAALSYRDQRFSISRGKGWAYEDVLPHFRDIEDYRVERPDGCSRVQTNVADGERVSASKAFIQPVIGTRKNLHVALFSQVSKVNFDGKRAVGVTFTRYGKQQNVSASREVILSAGTIGSTQLLLLSGIGPREQLGRLQIPVVADLPVGRNLQDHVGLLIGVPVKTDVDAGIHPFSLDDIAQYASNRTGTISIPVGGEFLQFLHSDYAADTAIPDIEVTVLSATPASDLLKASMVDMGLQPEAFDNYIGPTNGQPGFRVAAILNRPKSRGSITLRSTDPNEYPDIDEGFFNYPW